MSKTSKESFLEHQIAVVRAAGYYVIPVEQVRVLQAEGLVNLDMIEKMNDSKNYMEYRDKQLLLSLAAELAPVVKWIVERDDFHTQLRTRVKLAVILPSPKEDNSHETPDRVHSQPTALGQRANVGRQGS